MKTSASQGYGIGWSRGGVIAAIALLNLTACQTTEPSATDVESDADPAVEASADPTENPSTATEQGTDTITFADAPSPDGGTMQQLTLPGPQSAVLVTCDQEGFIPFLYMDMGLNWVGCQVPNPGDPVGAESPLTAPTLEAVDSPVGGTVNQITIPGPQSAFVVVCEGNFEPFLYEDQGDWVGCQTL